MKKVFRKKEKGEMGIGTLIIFIAMIIVAAVAATVLIQTAYQLQQQAEETGNVAIQDVATGFKVIHIGGVVDNSDPANPKIKTIEIKVGLLAGSPAIDLDNVLIEITDGKNDYTLSYTDKNVTDDANVSYAREGFNATTLRDMYPKNLPNDY